MNSDPVEWPSAPPFVDDMSATPLPATQPPAGDRGADQHEHAKRPIIHRIWSSFAVLSWFPLGAVVLFGANYCPAPSTATKVAWLSLGFVTLQVVGNATGGWILDRRYGRRHGGWQEALFGLGRSLLLAVALVAVGALLWWLLNFLPPHGSSGNCS